MHEQPIGCAICRTRRLTRRVEEIAFRQLSDKGYINCSVSVWVGKCDTCHTKSIDQDAERICDQAFKDGYSKCNTLSVAGA